MISNWPCWPTTCTWRRSRPGRTGPAPPWQRKRPTTNERRRASRRVRRSSASKATTATALRPAELAWPGTTVFCLNATKPAKLPASDREFPSPLDTVSAVRERRGGWIDVSRPYCWDLPMLIAQGQVDSIQIAHANLCRDRVIDNEGEGKPRDQQTLSWRRRKRPMVAGHLLQAARMRAADSAVGR